MPALSYTKAGLVSSSRVCAIIAFTRDQQSTLSNLSRVERLLGIVFFISPLRLLFNALRVGIFDWITAAGGFRLARRS